jgi:phosphohistidine phosphatase
MKKLIIIRHGEFDRRGQQVADIDRTLDWRGRHQVSEMATRLASLEIKPDLIISSPAKRAVETAEVYAAKLGVPSESIRVDEAVYEAERVEILRLLQAWDDTDETIVLCGHHPGVTDLLHHLVDSDVEDLPMGAFAVVKLSAETWRTVSFKQGELLEYAAPTEKEIRHGWWWRFTFWRRQKVHKVELIVFFLIGLLLILAAVALMVSSSADPASAW